MKFKNKRSKKGASMIVLTALIAFFIVLPLGLVSFEMGRYFLLITQLENIAGACALAGTGAIATIPTGSGSVTGSALQKLYNACSQEAVYCLQLNNVLGSPALNLPAGNVYNNTLPPNTPPPAPAVGNAAISCSFVNQDGSWHKDLTTSGAVKMLIAISYTTSPVFSAPGMMLSLMPTETAVAYAAGGLPQLDVFLCFDLSGSMDDQTGVCLVNRYWDVKNNCVAYDFSPNWLGKPNTLYNQMNQDGKLPLAGTQVNAIPPQNLSYYNGPMYFNELVRCGASVVGSPPEMGQPPGGLVAGVPVPITYPDPSVGVAGVEQPFSSPGVANPNWMSPYSPGYPSFTDMVVIPSTGAPGTAYVAPVGWKNTAVIEVEESRGNLTNIATFNLSQGGAAAAAKNVYKAVLAGAMGTTYQQYWQFAALNTTPSSQALQAAQNFVTTMNLSTDARFGVCTFCTNASNSTVNTYPSSGVPVQYLITEVTSGAPVPYLQGGKPAGGTFPLPFVSLSSGTPASFNNAFAGLKPPDNTYDPLTNTTQAVATAETNIYDAFNNGIIDITTPGNFRKTAKQAIVIFTDGIPTASLPNNNNAAIIGLATTFCKPNNIPVYTIGLAQGANPALVAQEDALLQPLAAAGAQGGLYIKTTTASQLNSAFQSIARSLVLLQGQ